MGLGILAIQHFQEMAFRGFAKEKKNMSGIQRTPKLEPTDQKCRTLENSLLLMSKLESEDLGVSRKRGSEDK